MVDVIPTNLGIVIKIQIVMSVLKSGIHIDNVDSFASEAEIPCIQDPHSIVSDMPSLIPSGKLKESLIKLSSKFEMMHLKLTKDQSETKLKLFEQSKLPWTAGKRKKKCTTKWQKKEFSFDLAKCWWDPWSDWSATCRLVQVADELFPFYLHFFVLSLLDSSLPCSATDAVVESTWTGAYLFLGQVENCKPSPSLDLSTLSSYHF